MQIHFEFKYPEKFLRNLLYFHLYTDLISKMKYPLGKEAGDFQNDLVRQIMSLLGPFAFWFFTINNWFFGKIFNVVLVKKEEESGL